MTISAIVFDTHAELSIHAKSMEDFERDLNSIKELFNASDRKYDPDRKVWIIKNYDQYRNYDFMKRAIETRKNQLELFPE